MVHFSVFYLFPLSNRYRSGIRGHMKAVVMDLLRQYLKVEIEFQNGEEQEPLTLLVSKFHSGDMYEHAGITRFNLLCNTSSSEEMHLLVLSFWWRPSTINSFSIFSSDQFNSMPLLTLHSVQLN